MNSDQIKGEAKDIAGKIQKETGKLINSTSQEVKGAARQVEGKIQKQVGNAEKTIEDAKDAQRK